ncbi:MAG TPA: DUF6064 family protein [Saprospiraceae bacterium]|nr:DUF6064 family protein [Saprospiraceae bacterium]HNT21147.1 DUF6064 family protein [Saprospiraceae bacterium]
MNLPFTIDEFLEVFRKYNLSVFPMQVVFYLFGGLAIFHSIYKTRISDKINLLFLSLLWLWSGIVYHILHFSGINKAAHLFGALNIVQAGLLYFYGIHREKITFQFKWDIYGVAGGLLILYALLVYPILGYLLGHQYPASPTFGVPCPTTIFTFGMLLWSGNKVPMAVLIIPFLWSLIGTTAAIYLGMTEDLGLFLSALITAFLLYFRSPLSPKTMVG